MSCIHYKFKSALDYKTLTVDGLHISVADLKREIYEKEKIGQTAFDLQLTNAQTKKVYTDESELIPRNSSVMVQRLPSATVKKLPKLTANTDRTVEGSVVQLPRTGSGTHLTGSAGVLSERTSDLTRASDMSEKEKLEMVKHISTAAYAADKYQRGGHLMSGPPPPTYVCSRCNKPGHWVRNCPVITRATTGIPFSELMETTSDDKQAYRTPGGKYVVPIMHKVAAAVGKKEGNPFNADNQGKLPGVSVSRSNVQVPTELLCKLCNQLLNDAVLLACCGHSFCDDCIRQKLLESDNRECPNCHEKNVSLDSLIPNASVRQAVTNFRNQTGYAHAAKPEQTSKPYTTAQDHMVIKLINKSKGTQPTRTGPDIPLDTGTSVQQPQQAKNQSFREAMAAMSQQRHPAAPPPQPVPAAVPEPVPQPTPAVAPLVVESGPSNDSLADEACGILETSKGDVSVESVESIGQEQAQQQPPQQPVAPPTASVLQPQGQGPPPTSISDTSIASQPASYVSGSGTSLPPPGVTPPVSVPTMTPIITYPPPPIAQALPQMTVEAYVSNYDSYYATAYYRPRRAYFKSRPYYRSYWNKRRFNYRARFRGYSTAPPPLPGVVSLGQPPPPGVLSAKGPSAASGTAAAPAAGETGTGAAAGTQPYTQPPPQQTAPPGTYVAPSASATSAVPDVWAEFLARKDRKREQEKAKQSRKAAKEKKRTKKERRSVSRTPSASESEASRSSDESRSPSRSRSRSRHGHRSSKRRASSYSDESRSRSRTPPSKSYRRRMSPSPDWLRTAHRMSRHHHHERRHRGYRDRSPEDWYIIAGSNKRGERGGPPAGHYPPTHPAAMGYPPSVRPPYAPPGHYNYPPPGYPGAFAAGVPTDAMMPPRFAGAHGMAGFGDTSHTRHREYGSGGGGYYSRGGSRHHYDRRTMRSHSRSPESRSPIRNRSRSIERAPPTKPHRERTSTEPSPTKHRDRKSREKPSTTSTATAGGKDENLLPEGDVQNVELLLEPDEQHKKQKAEKTKRKKKDTHTTTTTTPASSEKKTKKKKTSESDGCTTPKSKKRKKSTVAAETGTDQNVAPPLEKKDDDKSKGRKSAEHVIMPVAGESADKHTVVKSEDGVPVAKDKPVKAEPEPLQAQESVENKIESIVKLEPIPDSQPQQHHAAPTGRSSSRTERQPTPPIGEEDLAAVTKAEPMDVYEGKREKHGKLSHKHKHDESDKERDEKGEAEEDEHEEKEKSKKKKKEKHHHKKKRSKKHKEHKKRKRSRKDTQSDDEDKASEHDQPGPSSKPSSRSHHHHRHHESPESERTKPESTKSAAAPTTFDRKSSEPSTAATTIVKRVDESGRKSKSIEKDRDRKSHSQSSRRRSTKSRTPPPERETSPVAQGRQQQKPQQRRSSASSRKTRTPSGGAADAETMMVTVADASARQQKESAAVLPDSDQDNVFMTTKFVGKRKIKMDLKTGTSSLMDVDPTDILMPEPERESTKKRLGKKMDKGGGERLRSSDGADKSGLDSVFVSTRKQQRQVSLAHDDSPEPPEHAEKRQVTKEGRHIQITFSGSDSKSAASKRSLSSSSLGSGYAGKPLAMDLESEPSAPVRGGGATSRAPVRLQWKNTKNRRLS